MGSKSEDLKASEVARGFIGFLGEPLGSIAHFGVELLQVVRRIGETVVEVVPRVPLAVAVMVPEALTAGTLMVLGLPGKISRPSLARVPRVWPQWVQVSQGQLPPQAAHEDPGCYPLLQSDSECLEAMATE
ncbi:MAG: hypothetical protein ABII72_02400 [Parcubacteria group bacterium]